jgi:hypothetical protein
MTDDRTGILLTGATGFLGGEVLARLLERRQGPVYALVRAPGADEAEARLDAVVAGLIGDGESGGASSSNGHLRKIVRIGTAAARALHAESLDIVTQHLTGAPFDLIIATNILPYFDDVELMLAMSNITAMLAPGGILLHNEPRPALAEITAALGLPAEQSRQAVIATVRDAPSPLVDSVFVHRRIAARSVERSAGTRRRLPAHP